MKSKGVMIMDGYEVHKRQMVCLHLRGGLIFLFIYLFFGIVQQIGGTYIYGSKVLHFPFCTQFEDH